MSADQMLLAPDATVWAMYERERAGRLRAEAVLQEMAEDEGDGTLRHVATANKALADARGARLALAERVCRRVLAGEPAKKDAAAWAVVASETNEETR